ncbi:histone-lysine N-methyltransferase, H3 lysine-9 specific SUVH6 isoform X2 [Vicia villosa]|uniref:histone-lysine N-methyltransferase, H3 lysine-9 specific SUVH6 isoform X2 n=1 Tax=Vicia villosa TaxID=3911 RepID=UPI00273BC504|nr:histone-lysine N-methyltransferase, H3 lysine-9 specific SUVH6 isoform X2 [Vicia villosa]
MTTSMPVCNEQSEEEFGKQMMELGDSSVVARPKFKCRKVCAVRDYPEGCGPFGNADGTSVEDKNSEDLECDDVTPDHPDDSQHSEHENNLVVTETIELISDCSLKKEDPGNLSDQVALVGMETLDAEFATESSSLKKEVPVENLGAEFATESSSLKKEVPVETLSAQFATESSSLKKEVPVETLGAEFATESSSLKKEVPVVSSHLVDGPILDNDEHANVVLADMETLGGESAAEISSLKKENPIVSSHKVDGSILANDEPDKVILVGTETSDMEFAIQDSVKQESLYMSKALSPVGESAMSDDSKSSSSNINIGGSGACMEEAVTRRYPPRRNFAAVRDFPRLCGRNAPRLTKDERLKELSSLNEKGTGQQNLTVDASLLKEVADTDAKEVENNKRKPGNIVQAGSEEENNATQRVKKLDVFEPSSEMRLALDNTREKSTKLPEKRNHHQVNINSRAVAKEEVMNTIQVEGTSELDAYRPEVQSPEKKPLAISREEVVLGLKSKSECPWTSGVSSSSKSKPTSIGGTEEKKAKKVDFYAQLDRSKTAVKTKDIRSHSGHEPLKKKKLNSPSDDMGQLVGREKNSLDPNENNKVFKSVTKSHGSSVPKSSSVPRSSVMVPPIGCSNFSGHENDSATRNEVRKVLRLFQAVSRKLLHEAEAKAKSNDKERKRVDLQAVKILKENGNFVNTGKHILGPVPGVEVGDEFQYRVELNIIGLHRQIQGGIDYTKHNNKVLATSIVASGGYADDLDNTDVLIYTGQGGNVMSTGKEPEDQKLERGNLALKNSSEEKNPVRVIRGSDSPDGKSKIYVYDGLYLVESFWQDMGTHGKLVYRFRLRRIPGQPELALKEVKKSNKFKTREGRCVEDISCGKERIPICAVNTIDNEKPPPFKYIKKLIYPDSCNLVPPEGCGCTNGCSDRAKCSCVRKNGGEIPFNHNGAIVEAKPLVYECGPKCKCPSTCYNRVSQHGINIQLEIFKTNSRGWGVRSLNSIASGSFICEYIGEVLEDKVAELRTGNDEYLFDIGNKNNNTLWDGLSTLLPDSQSHSCEVVMDGGFTIDAAQFGNVGRFVNHSCSPNLYAQNILYDHHDNRVPHVMLFAAENIPPLQELTYDYNYMIDQVYDSDGNVKKKFCYCGSVDCTGRLY